MAFTFQINNDVKFKHDEKLLAKAEGFRPEIKKERIHPARIVEVIEDPLKLNGVGVTESDKSIDKIEEYGLKRNDKMILDFGDHRVGTFKIHIDQTGSPEDAPLYMRTNLPNFRQSLQRNPKTMKDGSAVRGYRKSSFISMSFRQHWNFREDTASVMWN